MVASESELEIILRDARSIALVGASTKPYRDSNGVMEYLLRAGYDVIPVNPRYPAVLGRMCYPNLREISGRIDIVVVFRNPAEILPIVEDTISIGAKTLWLQLGVVNHEAIRLAQDSGLTVVVDRCIAVDHRLLFPHQ